VPQDLRPVTIAETRRFWTKRTSEQVSDENAREAVRNVTGFFELLAQWHEAQVSELHGSSDNDAQSADAGRT